MTDRPNRAEVGKIGEETACKYLKKNGFRIVERNYWQKWGEIDIVAQKDTASSFRLRSASTLHFIEVKTVMRSLSLDPARDNYEPEENVHSWKLKRLSHAIQTYCLQRNLPDDQEWQVDVLTVELDFETRHARVKLLEDIEL